MEWYENVTVKDSKGDQFSIAGRVGFVASGHVFSELSSFPCQFPLHHVIRGWYSGPTSGRRTNRLSLTPHYILRKKSYSGPTSSHQPTHQLFFTKVNAMFSNFTRTVTGCALVGRSTVEDSDVWEEHFASISGAHLPDRTVSRP
jgi:hypothetical protein